MAVRSGVTLNGQPQFLNPGGSSGSGGPATSKSLTVQNWGSSSSPGFHKGGMYYAKGEMPAGKIPSISAGTMQIYGLRYWSDGSLKYARRLLRDTAYAASESRTYTITEASGAMPTGATAAVGNAGLVAALTGHDVKMTFASVQQQSQTGGDQYTPIYGQAAHGSGAFTASLAAHAAVATRCTLLTTGPVVDVWQLWGMATDNVGGAVDVHLKVNWYVTRWKNADGSTAGLQIGAVPSLDWWSVANKYYLIYDAALVDGSTTIQSYPGVQHPYASQWLAAVPSGNNAGRAPWIGAAQPTLFAPIDQATIVASGLCPPIRTAGVPAAVAIPTYVPCGSMEHRPNIDGTGLYIGRGIIPQPDADCFKRNDAQSLARLVVDSLAGLGVPYHFRSNRTRQRPGDSAADTANTSIVLAMAPKAASYSDFTAQGLPIAVNAYHGFGASTDPTFNANAQDNFNNAQGGTGIWSPSYDASHAVSYCYFAALLTGDEWLLEAQIDLALNLAHQSIYGYHNNIPFMLSGTAQAAAAAAPSSDTRAYTGLLGQWQADNIRSMGCAQTIQGHAWGLIPNDHVAFGYSQVILAHNGDYIAGSLTNMPADYVAAGEYFPPSQLGRFPTLVAAWQFAMICTGAYSTFLMTEDARWKALGDHSLTWTARIAGAGLFYLWDQYKTIDQQFASDWSTSNRKLLPENQFYCSINPDLTGGTTLTLNGGIFWNSVNDPPPPFQNGDVLLASKQQQTDLNGVMAPQNMADGQRFYLINVSNPGSANGNVYGPTNPPKVSFQLAATPGGSAVNFGADTTGLNFGWIPASAANYLVATTPPYVPGAINYVPIHMAAIMYGRVVGHPAVTTALLNATKAFVQPMALSTYSPYDLLAA